jgi:hypothetical protein
MQRLQRSSVKAAAGGRSSDYRHRCGFFAIIKIEKQMRLGLKG